ncbi:hypothetical protein CAPTEDRAFT_190960 [Capitella teleta]|uniref:Fibronectin type-III domain-containing protein n=1 Tax=Capitella teleta TaxID=283909 RepID=R7TQJ9_CAPTE|nr:hypothetical protein CAPTEDRAFT_190960 [Capitella teleta]|eukprot:ELT93781.1 hypothetical protein CAPTEDRAFT_190960 [Capitella teleta]
MIKPFHPQVVILLSAIVTHHCNVIRAQDMDDEAWLSVGMCRASCANKFLIFPASNADCDQKDDLYTSGECFVTDGCQSACRFSAENKKPSFTSDQSAWVFQEMPTAHLVAEQRIIVKWTDVATTPPSPHEHPIFAVFSQYAGLKGWIMTVMTLERSVILDRGNEIPEPNIKVVAILPRGIVAMATLEPPFEMKGDRAITPSLRQSSSPGSQTQVFPLYVDMNSDGGRLNGRAMWKADPGSHVYTVTWMRTDCKVSELLPDCPLNPVTLMTIVKFMADAFSAEATLEVHGLTYNSRYEIEVTSAEGFAHFFTFYTPWCLHPDATFNKCPKTASNKKAPIYRPSSDRSKSTTEAGMGPATSEMDFVMIGRGPFYGRIKVPASDSDGREKVWRRKTFIKRFFGIGLSWSAVWLMLMNVVIAFAVIVMALLVIDKQNRWKRFVESEDGHLRWRSSILHQR